MPYFLKGIVSYIGTSYFGFQKQPNKLTVAGVLENSLKIIYKRPVKVLAAGRTDRGVHASGQVIAIKVDIYIDSERLLKAINSLLPVDITFISLDYTDKCFHPIQSAVARCYEYYVCSTQLPFYLSPFVLNYKFSDINLLRDVLNLFKGAHLFKAFSTYNKSLKPGPRIMYHVSITKASTTCFINSTSHFDIYAIRFIANAFLYRMIRHIVGSLIALESGYLTVDDIYHMLITNKKIKSWPLADPKALWFTKVVYNIEELNEI